MTFRRGFQSGVPASDVNGVRYRTPPAPSARTVPMRDPVTVVVDVFASTKRSSSNTRRPPSGDQRGLNAASVPRVKVASVLVAPDARSRRRIRDRAVLPPDASRSARTYTIVLPSGDQAPS